MKTSLLLGLTLSFFITSAQVEQTDDVESSEIIIETNDTVEFSLDVDEVVEYIDDYGGIAEHDEKRSSFPKELLDHPFVRYQAEVNRPNSPDSYPWISADGLRVYFVDGSDVFMASRQNRQVDFSARTKINLPKVDDALAVWLTNNEKVMVVAKFSGEIYRYQRDEIGLPWDKPTEIVFANERRGFKSVASFTQDEKIMCVYTSGKLDFYELTAMGDYSHITTFKPFESTGVGQLTKDGKGVVLADGKDISDDEGASAIYHVSLNDVISGHSKPKLTKLFYLPILDVGQPSLSYDESELVMVGNNLNEWDGNELVVVSLNNIEFIETVESDLIEDEFLKEAMTALARSEEIHKANEVAKKSIINPANESSSPTDFSAKAFEIELTKLYPNPSSDKVTMEFSLPVDANIAEVIVSDSRGVQVYRKRISLDERSHEVNLKDLGCSSGTYFFWVATDTKNATPKPLIFD